jgi:hypothetical protein
VRRIPAKLELARRAVRQQIARVDTIPAPVGGWNARDPLAAMKRTDAVKLENWFPRVSDVVIRGGNEDYATGFADEPKAIAQYNPPTAINKMFASTDAGIYDITAGGAIGASVLARTEGYHSWVQMGVSGGHYLMMFNGVDKPAYFDGTTWVAVDGASSPAITGITTTDIVSGNVFKRRLFFVPKDKLSFYYLAVDAVGGAATEFTLGPLCSRGGYLMAMATWTFDGGAGPDDYAVFITSEGEVVVFQGTDPGSSTAWSLVGVYFVGKPLGRKCFSKYGGDLILITEYGVFPLSKALQSASIDYKLALTNKIEGAFIEAARTYGPNQGWEAAIFPAQSALIFNVPTSPGSTYEQYLMNSTTKSWCKFTGWNARAFTVFGGELYFADEDRVAKAWTGRADDGANIVADAKTAYQNFGSASQLKKFGLFRPMMLVDAALSFSLGLSIDFENEPPLAEASFSVTSGAIWDTSLWDSAVWASGLEIKSDWQTPPARPGYWAAALLKVATKQVEVQWVANDYTYEIGGVL